MLAPHGGVGYRGVMPRSRTATIAGLLFIVVYVVAAITIPDYTGRMHWTLEAAYWAVAGLLWVLPIRWLMLWSVGKR